MALSKDLKNLIKSIEASKTNHQFKADRLIHEALAEILKWVESRRSLIQWSLAGVKNGASASALNPAGGVLSVSADLELTDADNVKDPFTQSAAVTVTLTGTAADKTINGVAGPLEVPLVDGKATVTLAASGTGTIVASLSAPAPSGLGVSDVLTVTLS